MKNKWIKDKQENLKSQDSDNLFIQTKESVRHIKNNIEDNKEVKKEIEKIDTFSDFLIYIIRKVTMKYNLYCKLWSGFTPLEVKTNLNGDFITVSDVLLKQTLLKLTIDNSLVFRTVDKDTDFLLDLKLIGFVRNTKQFVSIIIKINAIIKIILNCKKMCFWNLVSFLRLRKIGRS